MTAYLNQAIQQVSISLGASVTTNTATITAVGANAFLVYQGFTTNEATGSLMLDEFATGVLTNSTTVTVTRTTATTGTGVFNFAVIDPTSSLVTGVQAGTIAISGTGIVSNTATISSVDLTLSAVFFLGAKTLSADIRQTYAGVTLTNATTVSAAVGAAPGTFTTTVSFVVVTFAAGAIQSVQQVASASSGTAVNVSAATSAYVVAHSMLAYGGFLTANTTIPSALWRINFNVSGQVDFARNTGTSGSWTNFCTVIEFVSGVLTSQQAAGVTLNSVASNTVTVTAVVVANSFYLFTGIISAAASTAPDTFYHKGTLTNTTTVTITRQTAGITTSTVSGRVIEFNSTAGGGGVFNPYFYIFIARDLG